MINEDPKGAPTHDTHYMTHDMIHITWYPLHDTSHDTHHMTHITFKLNCKTYDIKQSHKISMRRMFAQSFNQLSDEWTSIVCISYRLTTWSSV